jgi:HD-like signal output (HDOD) protein
VRNGELECVHGVGHSASTHGCDGCCFALGVYERERIIGLLQERWSLTDDVVALIRGEQVSETTEQFYRRKERERIIKLLEEHHDSFSWQHSSISQDNCHACTSIALIKGENK